MDKYNGIDVTQFFLFLLQVGLTVLYIIFMDFTSDPSSKSSDIYGYRPAWGLPSFPGLTLDHVAGIQTTWSTCTCLSSISL